MSDRGLTHEPRPVQDGLLCRCSVCGREERAGASPLRNGWPKCCGYTMTLIDTAAFIAALDDDMANMFAPARVARGVAADGDPR